MHTTDSARTHASLLVGRTLVAALFLQSGFTKPFAWQAALDEIAGFGMPRSAIVLGSAVALQLLGGIALVLGLFTRTSAFLLLAFMIPATFYVHGFYRYSGSEYEHHLVGFFQNLTISGGLVLLIASGPGRWSLDARIAGR